MKLIKALIPQQKLFPLFYKVQEEISLFLGDLIIVSFRNKEVIAIVWEIENNQDILKSCNFNIKTVKEKLPFPPLKRHMLELIKKVSLYYLCDLGCVAKLVLPIHLKELSKKTKWQKNINESDFTLANLSEKQKEIVNKIILSDKNLNSKENNSNLKPILIKAVTGSGKTEIYFHIIAYYLAQNKQALLILPEISLSKQLIKRFEQAFHFKPIIWHSSVKQSEKRDYFKEILLPDKKVIIGTRSSIFLPYANLGVIIIDEEHDSSYKQEDNVFYHGRDVAILRANLLNIPIILGSATPAMESRYNALKGKYDIFNLNERYQEIVMPSIHIIDMKKEKLKKGKYLSPSLVEAIKATLIKQEQILLFLNRRGYAPLILCKACGYRFSCASCSSSLVMHKKSSCMQCHYCAATRPIPIICDECRSTSLISYGPGIEKIAEEVKELFQDKKIILISKDNPLNEKNLEEIETGKIDILIGTQVITKGYHFPSLTLVGVIDTDLGLIGGDLRASERTYQLLHQVGGRAGRSKNKTGKIYLQSYYPDNLLLNALQSEKEDLFVDYELSNRKASNMPPFSRIAYLSIIDKTDKQTFDLAKELFSKTSDSIPEEIQIFGPIQASIAKIANKYRYHILFITQKNLLLQKYLHYFINKLDNNIKKKLRIDIDPQNFY